MRRRDFIKGMAGAATAWPLVARAQTSLVRPLIGLLSPLSAAAANRNVAAFRSTLRDLGYLEGRNISLASRYGDGVAERMPSLARELVALNPDVIMAGANSGVLAAYNETRTIPIVTITPENPVTMGIAKSIVKPGGNVTGTWNLGDEALVGKELDLFKLARTRPCPRCRDYQSGRSRRRSPNATTADRGSRCWRGDGGHRNPRCR
jgi:putative ABC transport system substrate-binding protein